MLLCIAVAAICTIMRTDNRNHKNIIMLKKITMLSFMVEITKLLHMSQVEIQFWPDP